jgi:hypothetical protein
MPQIIQEGILVFTFSDDWDICKFDDTNFYRDRVEKLNGVKSIDILARGDRILYFIEIKDFRGHSIENRQRQKSGELLSEVAQKFINTLSALLGARRWNIEEFEPYYNPLFISQEQTIEVVLFLEREDQESKLSRNKLTLADLQGKLKKLLAAYKVRCKVYDKEHLPLHITWSVN